MSAAPGGGEQPSGGLLAVVVAGGEDHEIVVLHQVHEVMFVGDAAGPGARWVVEEWFGFADAGERVVAGGVVDELVDPFEDLAVGGLPVLVVFPGDWDERDLHAECSVRLAGGAERSSWCSTVS